MPKNPMFRQVQIDAIVELIRTWPNETIRWKDICKAVQPILGFIPSRQGLDQRSSIREAFQARKKQIRNYPKESVPMPSSLAVAAKRIAMLKAENAELRGKCDRFMDRFQKWQYNAHLKGISEAILDNPLPQIDREVGKSEVSKTGK